MNKRLNVYLMYAIVFLQGFVFYGPVATLYRQSRGLSISDIFLIESISLILMILLEIPWGWFADRFGYKRTLLLANFVYFLSKIIFFEAYSFPMFLAERVFLSIAIAGISGCDTALIYSSVEKQEAAKVFGRYNAFAMGGLLLASLMSTFMIRKSLSAAAFYTIIPYGLAAFLTLFIGDVGIEKGKKQSIIKNFKTAMRNKEMLVFVIAVALMNEVVQASTVFLNQAQYLRSGITLKYFGIITAGIQLLRLSSARSYKFYGRFGKRRGVYALFSLITMSCVMLIFSTGAVLTLCCIGILAMSISMILPLSTDIQNRSIITGDRATLLSIYAMAGDITSALVNPVIGWSGDISAAAAFKVCTVVCVIAFAGLVYGFREKGCILCEAEEGLK